MKRFLADPDTMTKDSMDGLRRVYPELVETIPRSYNQRSLLRHPIDPNRVNIIVSSGGWGGPFTLSFCTTPGMADAAVNGNICAAPSAYDIYETAKKINSPHGYLLLYNNFMGDCLNNDLALDLMEKDGLKGKLIPFNDDCLSVDESSPREERTGLTGIVYATKIASGYVKTGATLEEAAGLLSYVKSRISSVMVSADFKNETISLGEGISGEPPRYTYEKHFHLKDAAKFAYDKLYQDLAPKKNERVYVLINRAIYTFYEDQFILAKYLDEYSQGRIHQMSAGYFFRMCDSYSFSVTMMSVDERCWPFMEERCFSDSFIL